MSSIALVSPENIIRTALVAVELLDPVTLSLIHSGVRVTAQGLTGSPIISWSGRFVWLAEDDAWPVTFTVEPGGEPYESEIQPAPTRPPNLLVAPAESRLARITLRPTATYPFTDGVTSVRGQLRETEDPASAGISGADVWIRWANDAPAGPPWVDALVRAQTNQAGEFAAFLRLPPKARPTVENGNLVVRIAVSRAGQVREKEEQLPDGRSYDLPDALAWNKLTPAA